MEGMWWILIECLIPSKSALSIKYLIPAAQVEILITCAEKIQSKQELGAYAMQSGIRQ
jgi:hypothetical protein